MALIWSIALDGSEAWTLTTNLTKRVQAFEMHFYRRILRIPRTAKMTNQSVKARIPDADGLYDAVVSRKLRYFGHVVRHASLQADLMTGMATDTRRRGRPKRGWLEDVTHWSNLSLSQAIEKARDRDVWRRVMVRTAVEAASERQDN